MEFSSIQTTVASYLELIKITPTSFKEPLERATQFLLIQAVLADFIKGVEDNKAKIQTATDASYASAIASAAGKGIMEKKVDAVTNDDYTTCREVLEDFEAQISWAKTYLKIFDHAHLTYRMMAKEPG